MNSCLDSAPDREKVLRAIKRRPQASVFELVRMVNLPRRTVICCVRWLLRDRMIRSVPLPARPGVYEVRTGYEIAPQQVEPAPTFKPAVPAHWDPLAFLFGVARAES